MKFTDFIEILKELSSMTAWRFWAVWASTTALGCMWLLPDLMKALAK